MGLIDTSYSVKRLTYGTLITCITEDAGYVVVTLATHKFLVFNVT